MKNLLEFGNRYARQSSWRDFALVKLCLFSMGLAAGTQIPERHRKRAVCAAACVFAAAYLPLMGKMLRLALKRT